MLAVKTTSVAAEMASAATTPMMSTRPAPLSRLRRGTPRCMCCMITAYLRRKARLTSVPLPRVAQLRRRAQVSVGGRLARVVVDQHVDLHRSDQRPLFRPDDATVASQRAVGVVVDVSEQRRRRRGVRRRE